MLNTKLALHDLQDVEAFCSAALEQQLKRWNNAHLEPADRDDALAYLISETWRISRRYDPARSPSFTAYARNFQSRFLVQFYRKRFVDTRNEHRYTGEEWARIKQLVFAASLDAPAGDGDAGTLGDLVAVPAGMDAPDRLPAIGGLLRERDRHRARDTRLVRDEIIRLSTNRAA